MTELDLVSPDELDQEPTYRDIWRPLGIGWAVGTAIPLPTGENVTVFMTRWAARGPFERAVVQQLDELRPHLARSVLLSARLQLERARIASETLTALGLPALVLNDQGKVLAANTLIEALAVYVNWRAQDRVSLKDRAADQLLRDAIAAIDLGYFAEHHPHARSGGIGKNRRQPASRHCSTAHSDFLDAADVPGLARHHSK